MSDPDQTRTVGILGLGIIGAIWAKHYQDAGVLAGVWNRTPQPDFPRWREHPEAVATSADIIQIVVADPAAVESVLGQIKPALGPEKTVVQSSTIDPESSNRFRQQVIASGARYLEAPFTGSKPAAEAKQTVFYLGGDPDLIAALNPTLALISTQRHRIGDHRQACTLKLAMNLNISAQMQALTEALVLSRRAGISDDVFAQALEMNISNSGVVKLKLPQVRNEDYGPLFSVKHMHKDMRLAAEMKSAADLDLLALIRAKLARAEAAGMGDEDFAALFKLVDNKSS